VGNGGTISCGGDIYSPIDICAAFGGGGGSYNSGNAGSGYNGDGVNSGNVLSCGSFSSCQSGGGRGGSDNSGNIAGVNGAGGNDGEVTGRYSF
jgi:hypothetical protein